MTIVCRHGRLFCHVYIELRCIQIGYRIKMEGKYGNLNGAWLGPSRHRVNCDFVVAKTLQKAHVEWPRLVDPFVCKDPTQFHSSMSSEAKEDERNERQIGIQTTVAAPKHPLLLMLFYLFYKSFLFCLFSYQVIMKKTKKEEGKQNRKDRRVVS